MKYDILLQVFAVAVTYLMLSIPVSQAVSSSFLPTILENIPDQKIYDQNEMMERAKAFYEEYGIDPQDLLTSLVSLLYPEKQRDYQIQSRALPKDFSEGVSFSHGGPDGGGCFQANNLCENEQTGCNLLPSGDPYCETQQNCCYDCGCPDVQYCDGNGGDGNTNHWACRDRPANDNLITTFTSGSGYNLIDGGSIYFPEYNPDGNTVNFEYQITEFTDQAGAGVINELCSTDCSLVGGGLCGLVSCEFVSCGEHVVDYGDPLDNSDNLMQATNCQLKLTIDQHDPDLGYILTPTLSTTMDVIGPPLFQDLDIELSQSMGNAEFASYGCGDGFVNTGETTETCCYDVTCIDLGNNFYCDNTPEGSPDNSCKDLDLIELNLIDILTQGVADNDMDGIIDDPVPLCGADFSFDVLVQIENPPTGFQIVSQGYLVNGYDTGGYSAPAYSSPPEYNCVEGNGDYTCTITIPQDPNACQGVPLPDRTGTLSFSIDFSDSTYQNPSGIINRELTIELPVTQVANFVKADGTCNDGIGGEDLGEGQENSCYDCGCVEGDFCDGVGGPETYACGSIPIDNDLAPTSLNPNSFSVNPPESPIIFGYTISNFPAQAEATADNEFCESISCEGLNRNSGDPVQCTATCSIDPSTCTVLNSGGGSLTKENCELAVGITDGYNPSSVYTYTLSPSFSVDVNYNDLKFSGDVPSSQTLQQTFTPNVVFGEYWCGDGEVDPGWENANICCFDATCNELGGGYYCDTVDQGGGSADDGQCKLISDIHLEGISLENADTGDSTPPIEFVDNAIPHEFNIKANIVNKPGGLTVNWDQVSCSLGNDVHQIGCEIAYEDAIFPGADPEIKCESFAEDDDTYSISCDLIMDSINCLDSPFYDESDGKLKFGGSFSVPITFNNGPGSQDEVLNLDFPGIEVEVVDGCPEVGLDITYVGSESAGEGGIVCAEDVLGAECRPHPSGPLIVRSKIENSENINLEVGEWGSEIDGEMQEGSTTCIPINAENEVWECSITMDSISFNQAEAGSPENFAQTLYRCYNQDEGITDHMDALTRNECEVAGYSVDHDNTLGKTFAIPSDDKVELRRCYDGSTDHMTSVDTSECESQGYSIEGPMGYVKKLPSGTVPLYRCIYPGTGDHRDAVNLDDCKAHGYKVEGVIGFVSVEDSESEDTHQLALCNRELDGEIIDHYTSITFDEECEGGNFDKVIGYVYADASSDPNAKPLSRCLGSNGDHLTILTELSEECTEAGYEVDEPLGYIITNPSSEKTLFRCYNSDINDHMTTASLEECAQKDYSVDKPLGNVLLRGGIQTRDSKDLKLTVNVEYDSAIGRPSKTIFDDSETFDYIKQDRSTSTGAATCDIAALEAQRAEIAAGIDATKLAQEAYTQELRDWLGSICFVSLILFPLFPICIIAIFIVMLRIALVKPAIDALGLSVQVIEDTPITCECADAENPISCFADSYTIVAENHAKLTGTVEAHTSTLPEGYGIGLKAVSIA